MQITARQVDKLKQLDRIELRQRQLLIENEYDSVTSIQLPLYFGALVIYLTGLYEGITHRIIANPFLLLTGMILIMIGFIVTSLLAIVIRRVRYGKLIKEYFKVVTK